jgi:mono/diheme cytochrome c family protein
MLNARGEKMKPLRQLYVPGLLAAFAFCCAAQQSNTQIKKEPAPVTSPASGHEMYVNYCASCHGVDGKGDGPAAPAFKTPPSDLTTLAKRNGGKFPILRVRSILDGQRTVVAHGNQEMPVWGPVLRAVSGGNETVANLRIANLSRYVESLQEK